ncbi:hypothetical protein HanHA89_Chr14g0566501 [Helianthus annuus]|nr:hypothetical protein HanHA89_Chr14g0566501 [Helianthus annuus]
MHARMRQCMKQNTEAQEIECYFFCVLNCEKCPDSPTGCPPETCIGSYNYCVHDCTRTCVCEREREREYHDMRGNPNTVNRESSIELKRSSRFEGFQSAIH